MDGNRPVRVTAEEQFTKRSGGGGGIALFMDDPTNMHDLDGTEDFDVPR